MKGVAIVETAPLPVDFTAWLAAGRDLLAQRNATEWALADWMATGRETFGDQAAFDFLADELGIAPKQLKSAVKVATTFPAHLRDTALTFQHHESVANLPQADALEVLKRAKDEHLDDRETRAAAVRRQTVIEQRTLLPEDDWDHHSLMAITRSWNRAPRHVRQEFMELAGVADLAIIDA